MADTKPTASPQYPAPHLVDNPIDLHGDDEVSIVHWLWGEKSGWSWARPAQTTLPSQGRPPEKPRAGGCWAGPTLKELCTRVSSKSMTTQILSESWALASGSRYWTGVCCGDEQDWLGAPLSHPSHFSYTGLPTRSPLPRKPQEHGERPPSSQICPSTLEPGAGHLALWASLPHLGKPRQRIEST